MISFLQGNIDGTITFELTDVHADQLALLLGLPIVRRQQHAGIIMTLQPVTLDKADYGETVREGGDDPAEQSGLFECTDADHF